MFSPASSLKKIVVNIYEREIHPFTEQPTIALTDGWTKRADNFTFSLSQSKLPQALIAQLMLSHVQTMKEWFVYSGIQNFKVPGEVIEECCKQTIQHLRTRKIEVVKSNQKESSRTTLMQHIFETVLNKAERREKLEIIKLCKELYPDTFIGFGEYSKTRQLSFQAIDVTSRIIQKTFVKVFLFAAAMFTCAHFGSKLKKFTFQKIDPFVEKTFQQLTPNYHKKLMLLYNTPLLMSFTLPCVVGIGAFGIYKINERLIDSNRIRNSMLQILSLVNFILNPTTLFGPIATHATNSATDFVSLKMRKIVSTREDALIHDGTPLARSSWKQMDNEMLQKQL